MEARFNNSHFKIVQYKLNSETGRYQKEPDKIPFNKLPYELKVEATQKDFLIQQGANEIITGRFKNKVREFFTGLIPVQPLFYCGNDFEVFKGQKKHSLVVFEFSINSEYLTVYYFNHFYIQSPVERLKFIRAFIMHLINLYK